MWTNAETPLFAHKYVSTQMVVTIANAITDTDWQTMAKTATVRLFYVFVQPLVR